MSEMDAAAEINIPGDILWAVLKSAGYSTSWVWKSVSCIYMGRRVPLGSAGHFQTIKGYVLTPDGFANNSATVSPYMHRQPSSVMRQPISGSIFWRVQSLRPPAQPSHPARILDCRGSAPARRFQELLEGGGYFVVFSKASA
jgi:hypothetical protein